MPRLHLRPITDYTSSARYMPTLCGRRVSILDTTTRTDRADCPDCLGEYAVANAPRPLIFPGLAAPLPVVDADFDAWVDSMVAIDGGRR